MTVLSDFSYVFFSFCFYHCFYLYYYTLSRKLIILMLISIKTLYRIKTAPLHCHEDVVQGGRIKTAPLHCCGDVIQTQTIKKLCSLRLQYIWGGSTPSVINWRWDASRCTLTTGFYWPTVDIAWVLVTTGQHCSMNGSAVSCRLYINIQQPQWWRRTQTKSLIWIIQQATNQLTATHQCPNLLHFLYLLCHS